MRATLLEEDRILLFSVLKQKGLTLSQIAALLGISVRMLSDWKSGKYTIPSDQLEELISAAGLSSGSINPTLKDNWWYAGAAGKVGSAVRAERHGPLGTYESRRLGGRNSYAARKSNPRDIFSRKVIVKPEQDVLLAEFIGIMIGDGNMTNYQISIALSSLVDVKYSRYVVGLVEKLFGVRPTVTLQKNANCLVIVVSSIDLVEFLHQQGLLIGDKIRQGLDIPKWILEDQQYSAACVRGVFDTDGCVFQECHKIKDKKYCYPRWSLVSASPNLRLSIHEILSNLELTPKMRNSRSVNLEKLTDISTYFTVVGSSNPKHIDRWVLFGGVA